jgi:hypothetical protein
MHYTMGIAIGFIIGVTFTIILANYGNTVLRTARIEIEKCELSIPRNQQCTIVGVVKPK